MQSLIAQSSNNTKSIKPSEKALLQCSWTHLVRLLSVKNETERNFYLVETIENNWSVRELNRQIDTALYERILLNKGKTELVKSTDEIQVTDVLKDPYILEFLGLEENSQYSENDLEMAIINNLEQFLLELGKGFSFVARQYRISSNSDHFYIDLTRSALSHYIYTIRACLKIKL